MCVFDGMRRFGWVLIVGLLAATSATRASAQEEPAAERTPIVAPKLTAPRVTHVEATSVRSGLLIVEHPNGPERWQDAHQIVKRVGSYKLDGVVKVHDRPDGVKRGDHPITVVYRLEPGTHLSEAEIKRGLSEGAYAVHSGTFATAEEVPQHLTASVRGANAIRGWRLSPALTHPAPAARESTTAARPTTGRSSAAVRLFRAGRFAPTVSKSGFDWQRRDSTPSRNARPR